MFTSTWSLWITCVGMSAPVNAEGGLWPNQRDSDVIKQASVLSASMSVYILSEAFVWARLSDWQLISKADPMPLGDEVAWLRVFWYIPPTWVECSCLSQSRVSMPIARTAGLWVGIGKLPS